MKKIKVKSLYGNDITIEKLPDNVSQNTEGYCQIVFNSDGYVLAPHEIKKLKAFFQSI